MINHKDLLNEWVDSFTNDLFSWALHKISNEELAKDFVQDTFLAAFEKIDSFKGDSSPKTWLFSILNHKIVDFYRKKAKQTVHIDDSDFSRHFNHNEEWQTNQEPAEWERQDEQLLDDNAFQLVLQNCLNTLPEKWKVSMQFKYLMGKKSDEICQVLDITTSNYWQIIHRAKLQLRDCIELKWFKN